MSAEHSSPNVPGSGSAPQPHGPPYSPPHPHPHQPPHHPQQPYHPDSSAMKLTRGTSCVLCQQRKVRCDKNKPCANCVKAGAECRVVPPQPPRRRKKRLQEKDLVERLRKYETLLNQHGIKFDAIDQDIKGDSHGLDDVDELENDFEGLKTSPEASASPSVVSIDKPRAWFSLHKEFRASEQLLHDSSEEEMDGSTIHRAFDTMFANQDGFPFILGGKQTSVTDHHPSTIHILQLWQIYIDNVNPLLKVTHVPSIQAQIIEATSQLEQAPKNIEALMFGIYIMAITSLEEPDVRRIFNDSKQELLGRYFAALQQALVNASFMRIPDSITLQAYLLYLLAIRWFIDPRQVFCLIGIAVRIAQRMGLHRDPGGYGLPPFEVEQRRRLWWTIVSYDRRIGEITGSTVTSLTDGVCDCKIPLNINDSDLHVDGKEQPNPHSGPTEMLFALTRIELSMAVANNSNRDSFKTVPEKSCPSPQTGRPGGSTTFRLVGQDTPPYTLDGFCAHIEGTYLAHCDPKIPLHFFTVTMTRQALCKMRVINFLVRTHNSESMPLKEMERDDLFCQAIQMIEYDNVVQSSDSLRPYRWYAMHHFPFPAYMFIVQELRHRISGPLAERAWDAITKNYGLRGMHNNTHSPMHFAFGKLFVKAWAAHEDAQRASGKEVATPPFIVAMRGCIEKQRKAQSENKAGPSLENTGANFPRMQAREFTSTSPENPAMMTPPVDPTAGLATTQPTIATSITTPEDMDMDWSYLIAGYQDVGTFPFNTYGSGFGNPMGGMGSGIGGFGGPGAGNMFGS